MTIAIGVLCTNGAVIAADTEVSAGDFKGTKTKLLSMDDGHRKALAFAGAGYVGNIEAAKMDITAAAFTALGGDTDSIERVKKAIMDVIVPFHKTHNPHYGTGVSTRDFDTLIAGWADGKGALWCTDGTASRFAIDFDAIGAGETYAQEYLTGLYRNGPTDSGVLLVSYVMMRTKAIVRDCGKETQIIVVCNGRAVHIPRAITQEIDCLWEHNAGFQGMAFNAAVGLEKDQRGVSRRLRLMTSEFDKIRQSIRAMSSEIPHT